MVLILKAVDLGLYERPFPDLNLEFDGEMSEAVKGVLLVDAPLDLGSHIG